MKHDEKCERVPGTFTGMVCRCEVRALEALIAEWRPVMRALNALAESGDAVSPLGKSLCSAMAALSPAAREAAK
jgi:hypothetical protein